jgi:hypothetical protein
MKRREIFTAIHAERIAQHRKWSQSHDWGQGDCSSPDVPEPVKAAVLAEECGEVARAVLDRNPDNLRTELIQVAAVAVAWLEGLGKESAQHQP